MAKPLHMFLSNGLTTAETPPPRKPYKEACVGGWWWPWVAGGIWIREARWKLHPVCCFLFAAGASGMGLECRPKPRRGHGRPRRPALAPSRFTVCSIPRALPSV